MPAAMGLSSLMPPTTIAAPEVLATNTLTLTNLTASDFAPENLSRIRSTMEGFGHIYNFSPIKSFARIIVVYYNTADSQMAKEQLTRMDAIGKHIRVYFGQHTPIYNEVSKFLHVPEQEKNWLISPPGSPPIGWSPIREDPPNTQALADDLAHALARLGGVSNVELAEDFDSDDDIDDFMLESPMFKFDTEETLFGESKDIEFEYEDLSTTETGTLSFKVSRQRSTHVLTITHTDADDELPIITVEDWDGDVPVLAKRRRKNSPSNFPRASLLQRPPTPRFTPTSRPPIPLR